ncbi:MAG: hypothetical protein V2I27_03090 [Erythrobacter sp.]|nr:hypothetical protein [Erythrobacter sp.]
MILLAIAPGGEAKALGDGAADAEPLVLRLAAPQEAPEAPAASAEPTRLAAATPSARRGTPRVSKVRCAPMVCQSGCPVATTSDSDAAPETPSQSAARLARASAPEPACAHVAGKAAKADSSR